MSLSILSKVHASPNGLLTELEILKWFPGSTNSRYSKVKRLLAQGKLLHLRRGLYCLTDRMGYWKKLHPFNLAQYVYGPSYISLESALSFHQLIPETVYGITSVTIKRAREFNTPLGLFTYLHLPQENFYVEVDSIRNDEQYFFMAKPWKAICDYVFCYKKDWIDMKPLAASLRIDLASLPILYAEECEILMHYYQHKRITRFLKGVSKR